MKVAGIQMSDPWASRALRTRGVVSDLIQKAPVEAVVEVERVFFSHHGQEKNYRPMLRLSGELNKLVMQGEALPHDINEVTFRAGMGPVVDAYYEFSDAQLVELVGKGYFTEGFEPPTKMSGIPWELPTTIDALVLAPEGADDVPVVFVAVHGQSELALDMENSGYDLAEYFDNQLTAEKLKAQAKAVESEGMAHSGPINDLFSGDTPVDERRVQTKTLGDGSSYPVVKSSIFDELLSDFEERRAAEAASKDALPKSYPPGSVEEVYNERIAPGVAEALTLTSVEDAEVETTPPPAVAAPVADTAAPTPIAEPVAEAGLLDLYGEDAEDELDVAPVAIPTVADVPAPQQLQSKPTQRVFRSPEHQRAIEQQAEAVAEADSSPELD